MNLAEWCSIGWLLTWTGFLVYVRQIIHKIVCFIAINVGLAVLYLTHGASFLGAVQLILYVGGILVLMAYVLMLTPQEELVETRRFSIGPALLTTLFLSTIFLEMQKSLAQKETFLQTFLKPSLEQIGKAMVYEHAIFLEIIGIALLIALAGVVNALSKHSSY